jgi:hypothetical protein
MGKYLYSALYGVNVASLQFAALAKALHIDIWRIRYCKKRICLRLAFDASSVPPGMEVAMRRWGTIVSLAVLLAGDSIVFGGNFFKQADKLGPQLEQASRRPVYSLAAGGWSFSKELGQPLPQVFTPLLARLQGRADIIAVAADSRWTDSLYWDPQVHPSATGNKVLAQMIAQRLQATVRR